MKIAVCMKQVCYVYARTGLDPDRNFLAPEDKLYRLNPYDEVALEAALQQKEGLGGSAEVLVLTLGPMMAESHLRRCLALGADEVYHLDLVSSLDQWQKAAVLADAARLLGAEVVLCGKESVDGGSGQVGAFMARRLDWPLVSAAIDITILPRENLARVRRSAGRGVREVIQCSLPAVLSLDVGGYQPRLPTYAGTRRARTYPIKKLGLQEAPVSAKVSALRVYPPRPRPKPIDPPDSRLESFYRIQQLLSGSQVEKSGVMLEGDTDSQVEGIISFLKEHGFIKDKK